jgi:hypothetical protein
MRFVGLLMVVKYPPYDSGSVQGRELGHYFTDRSSPKDTAS